MWWLMEDIKTKVACFTIRVVQGLSQGWGNWARVRYLFGFLGRVSAENDYGTVHFLNFYDKVFESTGDVRIWKF